MSAAPLFTHGEVATFTSFLDTFESSPSSQMSPHHSLPTPYSPRTQAQMLSQTAELENWLKSSISPLPQPAPPAPPRPASPPKRAPPAPVQTDDDNPPPLCSPPDLPRSTVPARHFESIITALSPFIRPIPADSKLDSPTVPTGKKAALLSDEQKRANHIASEQKRRAAIREGYDRLCTVVPSLRSAVKEFDDRLASAKARGKRPSIAEEDSKTSGKRKRGEMLGALSGGIEIGGEKVDGRAGPKSEAVVLSRSVEYIRQLLVEREEMMSELQERHRLHPGLPIGEKVWDHQWSKPDPFIASGS